jgi:hypothetical protein
MHVGLRHLRLRRRRPVPNGVGEVDAERSYHQTSRTDVKVACSLSLCSPATNQAAEPKRIVS